MSSKSHVPNGSRPDPSRGVDGAPQPGGRGRIPWIIGGVIAVLVVAGIVFSVLQGGGRNVAVPSSAPTSGASAAPTAPSAAPTASTPSARASQDAVQLTLSNAPAEVAGYAPREGAAPARTVMYAKVGDPGQAVAVSNYSLDVELYRYLLVDPVDAAGGAAVCGKAAITGSSTTSQCLVRTSRFGYLELASIATENPAKSDSDLADVKAMAEVFAGL